MNTPSQKNIIENINSFIDMGNIDFDFMLGCYIDYIQLLSESEEFRSFAGEVACDFLRENIDVLRFNLLGQLDSKLLAEKKVELWGLHATSNNDLKKIVRLIITGLASKEGTLNYSNYPEYISADMLEISISTLYDLNWKYANDFCLFLKGVIEDKQNYS